MSISLRSVAKSYGHVTVLESVDLDVSAGEKVGLIGSNGSGKTTLLRLVAGLETPDGGVITVDGSVSLMEQVVGAAGGTVLDLTMPARLREARAALESAEAALSDPTDVNLGRYAAAEERFRLGGGYDFPARAAAILEGLGLSPERRVAGLSGGELRKALIARQLVSPAATVLLDEPTNHLDASAAEWLEEWVRTNPAGMLIASHDRAFLDATVTQIAELAGGRVTVWPGNYSAAMELRRVERLAQGRRHDAQVRERQELRAAAARLASQGRSAGKFNHKRAGNQALILSKAKAEGVSRTLARRAKALEQRAEQMTITEEPKDDDSAVNLALPDVLVGPGEVLRLGGVSLERGGRRLVEDLSLLVVRGEKVALLGPNGSGKSSLIALAAGELAPSVGEVVRGHGLTLFRFTQHGEELLAFGTIGEALTDAQPGLRKQDLYHLLGRLGLPKDPGFGVAELSGGERSRLALARLMVTRAQLLLLDEPTNHLDVGMVEALEELLVAYPGTVLFASHDRRLVERVATRALTSHGEGAWW